MKRVLLVAYFFPPLSNIGSLRPYRLSMHLKDFGWDVTVLTVANDKYYKKDSSLSLQENDNLRIIRVNRLPIHRLTRILGKKVFKGNNLWYSFLDPFFDWYPIAKMIASEELKRIPYDAILATAPPYSVLHLARTLAQEHNIPSIADLRDPFTQNQYLKMPTSFHRNFYHKYEADLLEDFDSITVAWPKIAEWDSKSLGIPHDKFVVITNGYEKKDFDNRYHRDPPSDKFRFGYFGSIYGLRRVDHLFRAFGIAAKKSPQFREKAELIFSGAFNRKSIMQIAAMQGCYQNLRILDYNTRNETLDWMSKCNILVLLTGMVAENYPGKVFDYMASNRPILNLSKPNSLTELIDETKIGVNLDGDNPDEVVALLLDWFDKFQKRLPILETDPKRIAPFEGKALTKKMAKVLDDIQ